MRCPRGIVVLVTLLLATKVRAQAPSPLRTKARDTYVLHGTVRDSSTGAPVQGARIWPFLKGWGVVSDSQGTYELRWEGYGTETFIVRLCEEQNLAAVGVQFLDDSIVHRDISVVIGEHRPCTSDERPPWAVDSRDTARFTGHFTYSWEGGGWLKSCDGKTYSPDWDSVLAEKLKRWRRNGGMAFVRFQGRVAPDNLGIVLGHYKGPIYLVSRVEEARDARTDDCR